MHGLEAAMEIERIVIRDGGGPLDHRRNLRWQLFIHFLNYPRPTAVAALAWLNTPHPVLDARTPAAALAAGDLDAVAAAIATIPRLPDPAMIP